MRTKLWNKYQEAKKNKKGFTLVELIVVLVIIGILAAILLPSLLKYIDSAKEKQVMTEARTVYTAAQSAASEAYAKTPSGLVSVGAIEYLLDGEPKDKTANGSRWSVEIVGYKVTKVIYTAHNEITVVFDGKNWSATNEEGQQYNKAQTNNAGAAVDPAHGIYGAPTEVKNASAAALTITLPVTPTSSQAAKE